MRLFPFPCAQLYTTNHIFFILSKIILFVSLRAADATTGLEPKPVERQVEARPVDDSQGSMVRCVYFARTYIVSVQHTTATMWAGTNNGTVYVFTLSVPQGAKRKDDSVHCQLG